MRVKYWAMVMLTAALIATAAEAQTLPPVPGSTIEYKNGLDGHDDEQFDLFKRACDKNDAAGCARLAGMDNETFAYIAKNRRVDSQLVFARKAVKLLQMRCTPTAERDQGCIHYFEILKGLRREYPDLVLEGGRMLAGRCLSGMHLPRDCSRFEVLLVGGTPAENTALANWVDGRFTEACESGNGTLCAQGFARWETVDRTQALGARLLRLSNAAAKGCSGGSPLICWSAGYWLSSFANVQKQAIWFLTKACELVPKAGEDNMQKSACFNVKKIREANAKRE